GIDVDAHQPERFEPPPRSGSPIDKSTAPDEALGEAHVLGHRHPFDEAEVLMDEGDRLTHVRARPPMLIGCAAEPDLARGWLEDAGEDLDQRRLAGAVLTQER